MDAFAVSVTNGLVVKKLRLQFALKMAVSFGVAQAVMPFLGYTLGRYFADYIVAIDHFIAFGLLAFIGVKMIIESIKAKGDEDCTREETDMRTLMVMAIATSIDALAAGVGFAFAARTPNSLPILPAVAIIGAETFLLCTAGAYIGRICGSRLKKGAEILGGVVLILIGIKILVEHI
jgi:putative Mn2+ efflux pump MntP